MSRVLLTLVALAIVPAAFAQTPAPLLVDAAWLADHANDRNIVILHVDDEAEYRAGHIPNARFVSMQQVSKAPGPDSPLVLELLPPDDLRARLQNLGISDNSRIVVYGGTNGGFQSATRVILTLDYAGLGGQTSLLNGGLSAWKRLNRRVTTDVPPVTPGVLSARPPKVVTVDAEYVKAIAQKPAHVLADGRAAAFYTGVTPTMGVAGHIPGAVSLPVTEITDSELMVDRARLEAMFKAAGVKPGDTVIAYCHIGQQGTTVVFAARLLGHPTMLYDGSMQDWTSNKRGAVVK
jgi:thiosulfate/3-mercaptopyruvate sulfurtransferase